MSFPKALKSLYEEGPGGCRVDPGGEAKFIPSVPAQYSIRNKTAGNAFMH